MTKLLQDIQKATAHMVCREHQQKAKISIVSNEIKFSTCCEDFRTEITEASKVAFVGSAKQQISDMVKDFNKKLK